MSEHHRRLERMYLRAPVSRVYEPEVRIDEGRAEVTLPVDPGYLHAAGALHGSILFRALDDAAFFAANSVVEDTLLLTASFGLHFLRPVSEGHVRGVGELVHRGSRLLVAEARAYDAGEALVARGTGTFMPSDVELEEGMGYA